MTTTTHSKSAESYYKHLLWYKVLHKDVKNKFDSTFDGIYATVQQAFATGSLSELETRHYTDEDDAFCKLKQMAHDDASCLLQPATALQRIHCIPSLSAHSIDLQKLKNQQCKHYSLNSRTNKYENIPPHRCPHPLNAMYREFRLKHAANDTVRIVDDVVHERHVSATVIEKHLNEWQQDQPMFPLPDHQGNLPSLIATVLTQQRLAIECTVHSEDKTTNCACSGYVCLCIYFRLYPCRLPCRLHAVFDADSMSIHAASSYTYISSNTLVVSAQIAVDDFNPLPDHTVLQRLLHDTQEFHQKGAAAAAAGCVCSAAAALPAGTGNYFGFLLQRCNVEIDGLTNAQWLVHRSGHKHKVGKAGVRAVNKKMPKMDSFCWHTAPLETASINYCQSGAKLWCVPQKQSLDALMQIVREKQCKDADADQSMANCARLIQHNNLQLDVMSLLENGIKLQLSIQRAGSYMLISRSQAHTGWAIGSEPNAACVIAYNAALPKWIDSATHELQYALHLMAEQEASACSMCVDAIRTEADIAATCVKHGMLELLVATKPDKAAFKLPSLSIPSNMDMANCDIDGDMKMRLDDLDCSDEHAHSDATQEDTLENKKEHVQMTKKRKYETDAEKPFQCNYPGCTAKFASTSTRNRHFKQHTATKRACPTCAKLFTDGPYLKQHQSHCGSSVVFHCKYGCGASCKFKKNLQKHYREYCPKRVMQQGATAPQAPLI